MIQSRGTTVHDRIMLSPKSFFQTVFIDVGHLKDIRLNFRTWQQVIDIVNIFGNQKPH